jgi:phenylpyruvate tautomerase PptA (4-oxalocrotonate tautomerase family)
MTMSRRAILKVAAVGVALNASAAQAQTSPAGFGAPLTEVFVPAGVLTLEQKSAMIKDISDVLRRVAAMPADQGPIFVEIIEVAEGGFGVNGRVFVPRTNK